jgi:hypothetical protein
MITEAFAVHICIGKVFSSLRCKNSATFRLAGGKDRRVS